MAAESNGWPPQPVVPACVNLSNQIPHNCCGRSRKPTNDTHLVSQQQLLNHFWFSVFIQAHQADTQSLMQYIDIYIYRYIFRTTLHFPQGGMRYCNRLEHDAS